MCIQMNLILTLLDKYHIPYITHREKRLKRLQTTQAHVVIGKWQKQNTTLNHILTVTASTWEEFSMLQNPA